MKIRRIPASKREAYYHFVSLSPLVVSSSRLFPFTYNSAPASNFLSCDEAARFSSSVFTCVFPRAVHWD